MTFTRGVNFIYDWADRSSMLFSCGLLYERNRTYHEYKKVWLQIVNLLQLSSFDFCTDHWHRHFEFISQFMFSFSRARTPGFDLPTNQQADEEPATHPNAAADWLEDRIWHAKKKQQKTWKFCIAVKNFVKLTLPYVNDTPKIHLRSLGSVNVIYTCLGKCKFHLHMGENNLTKNFVKTSL